MTSSNSTTRRLIEEWLPINELSVEAVRERAGAVPNPAPHQLHVWWARRPLIASQAAVAASLLNDGVEHNAFTAAMGTYSDVYEDSQKIAVANAAGTRSANGYAKRRAFTHNLTPTEAHWLQDNLNQSQGGNYIANHTELYTEHCGFHLGVGLVLSQS